MVNESLVNLMLSSNVSRHPGALSLVENFTFKNTVSKLCAHSKAGDIESLGLYSKEFKS